MSLRPTRRLLGICLAAVIVYGAAANSLVVWLYVVAAMLVALLPLGLAGPLLAVRVAGLRSAGVRRQGFAPAFADDTARVFEGDTVSVALAQPLLLDRCELLALVLEDGGRLPASLDDNSAIEVQSPRRGRITVTGLEVESSWPVGLARCRRILPVRFELLVCPRYTLLEGLARRGAGIGGEDAQRRGHGEEITGLREYRSGDSRRHIHWQTTARAGQLMVVETAAPSLAAVRCVLDLQVDGDAADVAARAAATLLASFSAAGRPFRVDIGDGAPEARRWSEALPRLALASAPRAPRRAAAPDTTFTVRALPAGALVESPKGSAVLPPGATLEGISAALKALL